MRNVFLWATDTAQINVSTGVEPIFNKKEKNMFAILLGGIAIMAIVTAVTFIISRSVRDSVCAGITALVEFIVFMVLATFFMLPSVGMVAGLLTIMLLAFSYNSFSKPQEQAIVAAFILCVVVGIVTATSPLYLIGVGAGSLLSYVVSSRVGDETEVGLILLEEGLGEAWCAFKDGYYSVSSEKCYA